LASVPVAVAVKLLVNVAQAQVPAFQTSFIAAVATVTGVSASRVSITSIVAGSAIITTMIAPDPSGATSTAPTALAAAAVLTAQVAVNSTVTPLSFNNVLVNQLSNNGINVPVNVVDPNYIPPLITGTKCVDGSFQVSCPASTSTDSTNSLSSGAIAGIVVGSILFVAIIAIIIYFARLPSKSAETSQPSLEMHSPVPISEGQIKVQI